MFVVILVRDSAACGVVGWIDVDALDALTDVRSQESQRLKILTVDKKTFSMVIECVYGAKSARGKSGIEENRIHGQMRMSLKERYRERFGVAYSLIGITNRVDRKQTHPLFAL